MDPAAAAGVKAAGILATISVVPEHQPGAHVLNTWLTGSHSQVLGGFRNDYNPDLP